MSHSAETCTPAAAYPLHLDALVHDALRRVLRAGHSAVDATAGNGYDTLFLARQVGPHGLVWAFDVQQQALDAAAARLAAVQEPLATVRFIHDGHEHAGSYLPEVVPAGQELMAVVFILGYLPRTDKRVTTSAATTLAAVTQLLPRMAAGGVMALHAYTGQEGGVAEVAALEELCASLPYTQWSALHTVTRNKTLRPEHVFLLQRHV